MRKIMKKNVKRLMALVMVIMLFSATTVTAFAASGYNSMSGYNGTFYVNLSGSGSTGQITIRINSPEQNQAIWIKVTDPNGRVVWNRSNLGQGILPNNGNEIKSPTFSNPPAGNYKVEYGGLAVVTLKCWVYSW